MFSNEGVKSVVLGLGFCWLNLFFQESIAVLPKFVGEFVEDFNYSYDKTTASLLTLVAVIISLEEMFPLK